MQCNDFTFEMIKTVHLIKRAFDKQISTVISRELTLPQAHLIAFLHENSREQDVFQRDIEEKFELHRSSVSLMLNNMEKNGLILRVPVAHDARLKKIVLTAQAIEYQMQAIKLIDELKTELFENISDEERDITIGVFKKLQQNLK